MIYNLDVIQFIFNFTYKANQRNEFEQDLFYTELEFDPKDIEKMIVKRMRSNNQL